MHEQILAQIYNEASELTDQRPSDIVMYIAERYAEEMDLDKSKIAIDLLSHCLDKK